MQNSIDPGSSYSTGAFNGFHSNNGTFVPLGSTSTNASSQSNASIVLGACKSTGIKDVNYTAGATQGGGNNQQFNWGQGVYNGSAAVTSINIFGSASFTAGTIYVWGA
jgi:hypothetical protein